MRGEFEQFIPETPDGDVLSMADYDSLEHNLPEQPFEPLAPDEFDHLAARAASSVVGVEVGDGTEVASAAERAYDELYRQVEAATDKGLDAKAALYQLDPQGKIRQAYQDEQNRKQDALNRRHATVIRQQIYERQKADIITRNSGAATTATDLSYNAALARARAERRLNRS